MARAARSSCTLLPAPRRAPRRGGGRASRRPTRTLLVPAMLSMLLPLVLSLGELVLAPGACPESFHATPVRRLASARPLDCPPPPRGAVSQDWPTTPAAGRRRVARLSAFLIRFPLHTTKRCMPAPGRRRGAAAWCCFRVSS
mmetsp:Transcript_12300/g.35368  ORF Transcript_12300/g.35368 Transcript_12300/m.35368 type:complete len:142 (-) Transcript_12300:164-589(-)|eukprot:scaffold32977_cov27-Tisochrysis_lutea.AAC.2